MTESNEIKTSSINSLAISSDGGQQVLLVGLKPAYRNKPQYQKALQRELKANHELDHQNILRYVGEKDSDVYGSCIVMEWETARTLTDYLQERHSEEEKKDIIRQVADGVSYLHRKGLIHSALNASSIFITTKGNHVKILNFRQRFADRLFEPQSSLKFRAPEAKDGTLALDARTDIYSLGILLREMGLGMEYQTVIEKCTSIGRNDRYPDVDAFLEAFEHRRMSRRPASSDGPATGGNKKVAILISTIAALLVIAVLVFFNRNSDNDESKQPLTEMTDTVQNSIPDDATPIPSATPQANQESIEPNNNETTNTSELAFLDKLVPQMHIDIDNIYASGSENAVIDKRVKTYYKGLRGTLKGLNDNQFSAFDKAFADYIQQKNSTR